MMVQNWLKIFLEMFLFLFFSVNVTVYYVFHHVSCPHNITAVVKVCFLCVCVCVWLTDFFFLLYFYMCSPSWTLLPPPSPYHPSRSSQCTSPKHPASCIEPGLEQLISSTNHRRLSTSRLWLSACCTVHCICKYLFPFSNPINAFNKL